MSPAPWRGVLVFVVWLMLWGWRPAVGSSPPTVAGSTPCCGKLYVLVRSERRPKEKSRPVEGVTVELRRLEAGAPVATFFTDRNGRGAHVGLPEDTYHVRFSHPDFTTVEVLEVTLRAWPPVELTVALPPRRATAPSAIRRLFYQPLLITRDGGSIRKVIRN